MLPRWLSCVFVLQDLFSLTTACALAIGLLAESALPGGLLRWNDISYFGALIVGNLHIVANDGLHASLLESMIGRFLVVLLLFLTIRRHLLLF